MVTAQVLKSCATEKVTHLTLRLKAFAQVEGLRKRSVDLVEDLEEEGKRTKSRGKGKGKGKEVIRNVEEKAPALSS